jgi:hypothetical protein
MASSKEENCYEYDDINDRIQMINDKISKYEQKMAGYQELYEISKQKN